MSEHSQQPIGEMFGSLLESSNYTFPTPGKYEVLRSPDNEHKLIVGVGKKKKKEILSTTKVVYKAVPVGITDNVVGALFTNSNKLNILQKILLFSQPEDAGFSVTLEAVETESRLTASAFLYVAADKRRQGTGISILPYHDQLIALAAQICGYSGYETTLLFTDISKESTGHYWSTENMEKAGLTGYQLLKVFTERTGKPTFYKTITIP